MFILLWWQARLVSLERGIRLSVLVVCSSCAISSAWSMSCLPPRGATRLRYFIGVFFWWRGQKSTEEYLMASRSMGTIPMTLSLVASFMSAITLLGTPAELYVSGTQYVALVLAYPLVTSNNTPVLNFETQLNLSR